MSKHEEFPQLTPEANAAMRAAAGPTADIIASFGDRERRSYAAFLNEAIKQATDNNCILHVNRLRGIANNLHSPPPPPTLAEAQAADLDTPEGRAVARAFLATLGEAGQP